MLNRVYGVVSKGKRESELFKWALSIALVTAISGCSSGGGSESALPETNQPLGYYGAAMVGDLASFQPDNDGKMILNLTGRYFGNAQSSFSQISLNGVSGVYYDLTNLNPSLMLLSDNLAAALIPSGRLSTSSPNALIFALKNPVTTESAVTGKMFTYNRVIVDPTNQTPTSAESQIIEFKSGHQVVKTDLHSNTQTKGCWRKSTGDEPYFEVELKDSLTSCDTYTDYGQEGTTQTDPTTDAYYYKFVFRSPSNGRMGLVADKVDGTGFGFGLEKTAYTPPVGSTTTFQAFKLKPSELSNLSLNNIPAAQISLSYSGEAYTLTTGGDGTVSESVPKGSVTVTPYQCGLSLPAGVNCQLDTANAKHYTIYFNLICENRIGTEPYYADSDVLFSSSNYVTDWSNDNTHNQIFNETLPVYDGLACMVNDADQSDNYGVFIDTEDHYFMGINQGATNTAQQQNAQNAEFLLGTQTQ